jgi:lysophospholipase L1-like esterase
MALSCLIGLAIATPGLASEWVQTWGTAPIAPSPALGPIPATPGFVNQTIRQTIRVSLGGPAIRIRFTNEFGKSPLHIGEARVALADEKGNIQPGTERRVLFAGQSGAIIPPGSPYLSDPVSLPVQALGSISLSIYFPDDTGPCTCHQLGLQDAYISDTGNFTDKAFAPKQTVQLKAFVSGIDVESASGTGALVVLGDSITDGAGSTANANHRWPDLLANRLAAGAGQHWGVVNMGIGGNQLLSDGAGQSALARFDRDVAATPGARAVIIFEGINDLGVALGPTGGPFAAIAKAWAPSGPVTFERMIAGYRQLTARAHAKGLKVIIATVTPYEGAIYFSPEGEAVRQAINGWIRSDHEIDGFLDFDAAVRDPQKPSQIKDGLHMGDHLHGNDAGYEAMVAKIDLRLFGQH